jgi:hypothetical protein
VRSANAKPAPREINRTPVKIGRPVEVRVCQEIIESTFERVVYGFTTCLSYHMLW